MEIRYETLCKYKSVCKFKLQEIDTDSIGSEIELVGSEVVN